MPDEKDILNKSEEQLEKKEIADTAPCDATYEQINKISEKKTEKKEHRMTNGDSFITKSEGMMMLCATLAVLLICNIGINAKLNNINQQLLDNQEELMYKADILETKIETLEETLLDITDDLNDAVEIFTNKPINITIQNGEATVIPDEEIVDPTFDTRPFLGVGFYDTETVMPNAPGLKVDVVYEYSPAEFAGMKVGDYIIAINGISVKTYDDLTIIMDNAQADDEVTLDFLTITENGIEYKSATVTLTYRGNFNIQE